GPPRAILSRMSSISRIVRVASPRTHRFAPLVAAAALLASACAPTQPSTPAPAPARRAILVSFDALNERRVLETLPAEAVPNFRALFAGGACTEYARPAFPSVTAPAHASLWTGAYGDVNGIAANAQPPLPQDAHSLTERISGFEYAALRAEPLWVTAAAAGLSVVAHHTTQAPGVPGYPPVRTGQDALAGSRTRAASALARPAAHVLNGYNRELARGRVMTQDSARPRPAAGWRGLERLPAGTRPPLEIAWTVGRDSVYGLLYGAGTYTHLLVAPARDAARGVVAAAAAVDRAPLDGRPLARHFSEPMELQLEGGRAWISVRLWELAPDGTRFRFYYPEVPLVEANRPEVAAAYHTAVRGWIGNAAGWGLDREAFGPTLGEGGDGEAEWRYLETAEFLTRQFIRGAEWGWMQEPALMLDYFPLGDEVDHRWYGYLDPDRPGYDAVLAARIQEVRTRGWQLVDHRLGHLRALVARSPGTALFVGGDHGMRATWRVFRPNVALARAGLLGADDAGRIDLSRTQALTPNGYWISLNRTARKDGIVPPEREAEVLAAAERALLDARGEDGAPIVTRTWRAAEHDSLGIGGPAGGDLYYELAPGYTWTASAAGPLTQSAPPSAGHGFPSVSVDMRTALCAEGAGFRPLRTGPARTIDAAPTVSAWLGIAPPPHAVGRSLLPELMRN
ncbi:MAG TPA: alkaline phosphatase family protein, partial [Longimicrobium sp.]|nr:alkaline phosphatase family protein [Longimicrobium sp.]